MIKSMIIKEELTKEEINTSYNPNISNKLIKPLIPLFSTLNSQIIEKSSKICLFY